MSKNITEINHSTNLPAIESNIGTIPFAVIEDNRLTFDPLRKRELATYTRRNHGDETNDGLFEPLPKGDIATYPWCDK